MTNRRLAVLATLFALGTTGCAAEITGADARRLQAAGARLLDVRSPSEFAERHIDGSLNIPVEQLEKRTAELGDPRRPIVVYCHSGVRAFFAKRILARHGYTRVASMGTLGRWFVEPREPQLF